MFHRRPRADNAVISALESCKSNTRMKRMVMFGLRTLSELCIPPSSKYLENSLDALGRGVTITLNEIITNIPSDDEILDLIIKICWGIARGLEEYHNTEELKRFVDEGGPHVISESINALEAEMSALTLGFETINILTRIGVSIYPQTIANALLKGVQQKNISTDIMLKIIQTIETIVTANEGEAKIFKDTGLDSAIMSYIMTLNQPNDPVQEEIIHHALKAIGVICSNAQNSDELVLAMKSVLDKYKNRKLVQSAGVGALERMVSLQQLEQALKSLSSTAESETSKRSLELIAAISTIPSFATKIVESDTIPLLVQGIKHTQDQINEDRNNESVMRGLIGSMNILGSIAKNKEHVDQVYNAGGVIAIVGLLNRVIETTPDEAFTACCSALASIASSQVYAEELYQTYDVINTLLSVLYNYAQIECVRQGVLDFLETVASHTSLHQTLIDSSAVEIIGYSLQYTTEQVEIQMSALKTIRLLVPHVQSTASLYEYGGFNGLAVTLTFYKANKELCLVALPIIATLVAVPDSKEYVQDGILVDAVLSAMLQNQTYTRITEIGVEILQHIATKADVERYIESLESALANSSTDSENALKSLAGTFGLSQIARLCPFFVEKNVTKLLLQHFSKTSSQVSTSASSKSEDFALNAKFLRAEMIAVESITLSAAEPIDSVLSLSFNNVINHKLKPLAERDEPSMETLLLSLSRMTATQRLSSEESISNILDAVIVGLKLFSDRKALVEILLIILKHLSTTANGLGAQLCKKKNIHEFVLNELKNKMFSLNIQINGLTILQNMLESHPELLPELKSKGTADLINADIRTYTKNKTIRDIAASLLAQLISPVELTNYISRNIAMLHESIDHKDFRSMVAALQVLTVPSASPNGNKILTRLNVAKELRRLEDLDIPEHEKVDVLPAVATLVAGISCFPTGKAELLSQSMLNYLLKCIEDISEIGDEEGLQNLIHTVGNILEGQQASLSARAKRQIVTLHLKVAEDYPKNLAIVSAVARVIGLLSTTEADASLVCENPKLQTFLEQNIGSLASSDAKILEMSTESLANLLTPAHNSIQELAYEKNIVDGLVNCLDQHSENPTIVENSAKCISSIGKDEFIRLRDYWLNLNSSDPAPMRTLCGTYKNCIDASLNNPHILTSLINSFCRFADPQDSSLLREEGVFAMLTSLCEHYPDDEDLGAACSSLVQKIGSDELVKFYIQNLLDANEVNDFKTMDDAIENLNALLLSSLEDPEDCLANEEYVWEALVRRLQSALEEGNVKPIRKCCVLAQRLVAQGKTDAEGYRGPWYFSQYMLPVYVEMLDSERIPLRSTRIISPMMGSIGATLTNDNTRPYCVESLPIPKIIDLLETCLPDPASMAGVMNVLARLCDDSDGVDKLQSSKKDLVPMLTTIMRAHRGRPEIIMPAAELLAVCCSPSFAHTSSDLIKGEPFVALEHATDHDSNESAQLNTGFMNALGTAAANPKILPVILREDYLSKALERYSDATFPTSPNNGLDTGGDQIDPKIKNQLALIQMLEGYATSDQGELVRMKGGTAKLVELLDDKNLDENVRPLLLKTLMNLASSDPLFATNEMLESVVPQVFPWCTQPNYEAPYDSSSDVSHLDIAPELYGHFDAKLAKSFVKILNSFQNNDHPIDSTSISANDFLQLPRTQNLMNNLKDFLEEDKESLKTLEDLIEAQKNPENNLPQNELNSQYLDETLAGGDEINTSAEPKSYSGAPSDPNEITLKQIHDWLKDRINKNLPIHINDTSEPLLGHYVSYILQQLTHYETLRLKYEDFAGYQSQWGCKAWDLWLLYTPDICPTLVEWNVPELLFKYLASQSLKINNSGDKEVVIASPPSQTLAYIGAAVNPPDFLVSSIPNLVEICTRNIEFALEDVQAHSDDHFIPRLSLVEVTAIDRTIYSDPKIVRVLNAVWDLYDNETLTINALIHTFRAFRQVLCDNHVQVILELGIIPRLLERLKQDDHNTLLIHGFFLLGVLAVDGRMKTVIGNYRGVEESLIILSNHINDPPGQGVITNSQLAIANLVVAHKDNCSRFYESGGLELNVRVLNERAEHFDEVNAASALLTNACFRRDDMKQAYGLPAIGATAALSYAISCYDGSTDEGALRCLINLFKAISNMSLYTPNVELFLQSGLEIAYFNLLEQSNGLSNDVVKTGLYTLSNLTWENKPENMLRFGIIMPPLIQTISQSQRHDPILIGNGLETLSCLCRCQENAEKFAQSDGLALTVELTEKYAGESLYVLTRGVECIGVLARFAENASYFDVERCLTLLKNVVEGTYFDEETSSVAQEDAATIALRSTRRVLTMGGAPFVGVFNQLGFNDTLLWYISLLSTMNDVALTLITESLRLLITCISLGRGEDPTAYPPLDDYVKDCLSRVGAQKTRKWFSRATPDAAANNTIEPITRSDAPRGHEVAGFDAYKCSELTSHLLEISMGVSLPKSIRACRFILGWLAYVTAEGLAEPVNTLFDAAQQFGMVMQRFFEENGCFTELYIYLVSILASLGYNSPDRFLNIFNKENNTYKLCFEMSRKTSKFKADTTNEKAKQYFESFVNEWKSATTGESSIPLFARFYSPDISLAPTQWSIDAYPNGVHDLIIKEELRNGGNMKIVTDEHTIKTFYWKANQTLSGFQWRIHDDASEAEKETKIIDFPNIVSIHKIVCINKGLCCDLLCRAAKKLRGVSNDNCLTLEVSATEESPKGCLLALKLPNKSERDKFVGWLQQWKEACIV